MRALIGYRFGGLKKRNGRGEVRTIDPLLAIPRFFPTELHSENWLIRRMDAQVASIEVPTRPLEALVDGRVCKGKFSLLVTMKDGRRFADIVLKKPEDRTRHAHAAVVAHAHVYQLEFRDRELIRADSVVTSNLKMIRQRCVLWADLAGPVDEDTVVERLGREPMTRGELYELLADTYPTLHVEQMDCILFAARLRQRITFNLGERYGDSTKFQCA